MALEKVDAVIVGAGAAGSVFAAVLARAGKKVVLLEQGPDWKLTDLISSDIWAGGSRARDRPSSTRARTRSAAPATTGGAPAAPRCTTPRTFRASCPTTSR
jgi:choline dehydrogenase-like flavoprotein